MADARANGSAAMLIRLSDPTLVGDLRHHFARAEFATDDAGGSMVEVFRLDAPSADQERREIELHLRVWQAANPDATVEFVG